MVNGTVYIGGKLSSSDETKRFVDEIQDLNEKTFRSKGCRLEDIPVRDSHPHDGGWIYKRAWNISGPEDYIKGFIAQLEIKAQKYGLRKLTKEEYEAKNKD
jgi:hypothetical protein